MGACCNFPQFRVVEDDLKLFCDIYIMLCHVSDPQLGADCFNPKWAVDSSYSRNIHCFQIRWRICHSVGIGIKGSSCNRVNAAMNPVIINLFFYIEPVNYRHWWRVYNPGEGTPIDGHGREISVVMTLIFEIFDLIESLFYASEWPDWPPLSTEKNGLVSITFSSKDTCTQFWTNFSPTCIILQFLSILYKFSPWFSIQLTPFFIDLRSFWPLIFTKP